LLQLRETQVSLLTVLEKKRAAEDILTRLVIRAQQQGTVVNLQVHTVGGVISPGQATMEIVPENDELVVEVTINPLDIDIVHQGLIARVSFTAFKMRHTPNLEGLVTYVSADSLINQTTGEPYYTARVTVSPKELARLNGQQLYPGMPAQVMIVTDNRTPLQYLLAPITESFEKAFREN